MKTITAIARQFGLSRTTLLYYDRLGLLSPAYRTASEARLYSSDEEARLSRIVTYRRAGIPLKSIKHMLVAAPGGVNQRLETRLSEIQGQIADLRGQQRFIVGMLKDAVLRGEGPKRTRDQWVELLRACAFTQRDMHQWHIEMERDNPNGHARFLKQIGLSATEVSHIRGLARGALKANAAPAKARQTSNASAASP